MDFLNFSVGLLAGLLTCAVIVATFGKFVLRAIVKEVIAEVSKDWVSATTGTALESRITRLENQFDTILGQQTGK